MKLYYYCSYTESPVGFILGRLDYDSGQIKNYKLNKENIPPLIRKCFESGIIRKAAGTLPDESTHFLLVKKLTAKTGEGNAALKYYLNLALETEEHAEYANWLRKDDTSVQELADAIKSTMELDRTSDFGFTVRGSELKSLIRRSFHCLFPEVSPNDDAVYLELSSTQTDSSQLKEFIGIPDAEFVRMPGTGKWFRSRGKKKHHVIPIAVLLLIVAMITTVFLLMKRS